MSYTLYTTRNFVDDLDDLRRRQPQLNPKLEKTWQYLEDDPRHHQGSLRTSPLCRGSSGEEVLHSYIDDFWRVAWRYERNSGILLLRVGAHDFIDEYTHFDDDRIFSRLHQASEQGGRRSSQEERGYRYEPEAEQPIFSPWHDVHLRLLGVPVEQVAAVKMVTEIDDIFDLGLPDYAERNLADAYLLEDWSPDSLFDSSRIFHRTNADQLTGYCKGEVQQLLLNLSPEQDGYVEMQTTGPTLLKGVAGSGKTTVGIYRAMEQSYAKDLFSQDRDLNILFVTFTETLARVVERMFEEIYGKERASRVDVWVLREWLQTYLENVPGSRPVASRKEIIHAASLGIMEAKCVFPDSVWSRPVHEGGRPRGTSFFVQEISDVIKGRGLRTREAYKSAARVGRGTALGPQSRDFVWTVYEAYEQRLAEIDKWDYLDPAIHGLAALQEDGDFAPYDAVVVDEAQDLRPVELRVVSALAGGSEARNLLLLADPNQSIYYKGIPWKEGGITIAPARSFTMARNYRNTQEILATAWSLATHGTSDDLEDEAIPPEATDRRGPRPIIVRCAGESDQIDYLVETITELCGSMHCRPGDIGVLARNKEVVNMLSFRLQNASIPTVNFRNNDFDVFENQVKVITINSAKGLEFPIVFIADLVEGALPRNVHAADKDEEEAELRSERRLAYVGMTRAARRLYLVTYDAPSSRFLEEIDPSTVRSIEHPVVG